MAGLNAKAAYEVGPNGRKCRSGRTTYAAFRQAIYSRLAGYKDTIDAERLAIDPVMRTVVGKHNTDRPVASSSALSRFGIKMLTSQENLEALATINRQWVFQAMARSPIHYITRDR